MIEFTFWDILRNLLARRALDGAFVDCRFRRRRAGRPRRSCSSDIQDTSGCGASPRGYIALFQGTPLLMQLFLMFFGLPMLGLRIEPWTAAVLGLTFFASAYLAEIWRGGVEALPHGQWDAGASLGLHYLQELRLIILPQAFAITRRADRRLPGAADQERRR